MRSIACCLLALVVPLAGAADARTPADAAAPASAATPGAARPVEIRLKHGDDPRWAAPDWDDSDWQRISTREFPARAGIYWARIRVGRGYVDAHANRRYSFSWPADARVDAVFLAAVYAYEFYWDGRLLQRGGVVGANRAEEVAGPLDHLVRVPEELLGPGEHVIALRMSSYHYNFPATHFSPGFAFTTFAPRLISESRQPIVPLMLLAGALLMTATSLVMFLFTDRRRSLLLSSLLSMALAIFYGLIALRWLYNAPHYWHAPRLAAIALTTAVISALLAWLLAEQFGLLRRGQWSLLLAPLLVAAWFSSPIYEIKALWMCRAMLVVSIAIVGVAAWRRRPGARGVLAVLVVGLFLVQTSNRSFLDPFFFLFLEGLVFFVFAALGVQVRADRQRAREAELTAARLETELLKKNIQPHFLLNTLATIIEVIEQEPKTAVALIEALAGEFRILARVAGEKLIPLAQEIELCRAHLRVMSLRNGVSCVLNVQGVNDRELVPPALFHTLIENGLTHMAPRAGEQVFELRVTGGCGFTCYELLAHGGVTDGTRRAAAPAKEGTGTRYIKARLEESFTGRWSMRAGRVDGAWRTVIEIRPAMDMENRAGAVGRLAPRPAQKLA